MSEALEYIQSKKIPYKMAGSNEIHVACFFCNEPDDKRGRLYINIDPLQDPPALFFCHLCGEKGALNKIRKHFGDSVVSEQDDRSYIHNDILQEAAAYYHDQLVEHPEALNYLKKKRGLTIETIVKHQLGYADGTLRKALQEKGFLVADMQKTGLVTGMNEDFLKHHITIPYHVSGHVVMIRGRDFDTGAPGKYATPYGARTRLFNTDVLWRDNDMAVVTEGEFDCLVMEQLGYPTVGSPGSNVWQPSWNSYFDSTKRVFVLFDNDPSGLAGAEKVSHQIGPKARIVYLQGDDKTDPSELVVEKGWGAADFDLLFRRSRGGHLLSVDDGFEEWQGYRGVDGLKLGIERIDQVLAPGILPGQVMVVLAKTGTGKTLFLLNTFQRMIMANPNVNILFVSLEQTRGEWFERARRIYRFYNLEAKNTDCLEYFRNRLMLVDKNRVTEDELIACLDQYEYEQGKQPDVVAIDYLGYWARAYKGEPYERTGQAIMAIKAIAKDRRIAVITPHQVNRMTLSGEEVGLGAARDSGVVEETADFLLGLWSPDQRKGKTVEERSSTVALKILKSRHGGSATEIHMQFAPLCLAMIPQGDPLVQRAMDDLKFMDARDNFPTALWRHRTGNRDLTTGYRREEEDDE